MLPEGLTDDLRSLAAELDGLAEAANMSPPAFPSIPDFEPVSFLGCGGMGAVYEVEHIELGTHYALKAFTFDPSDAVAAALKAKFLEIMPDYDQDAVYPPDMKKVFLWYQMLMDKGLLDFTEEASASEEAPEETQPEA